jgi:CRP-like cAMP-binding protein
VPTSTDPGGLPSRPAPYYDGAVPLRRDAKIELLKKVPLFAGCSKSELRELAKTADELDVREGTVLTREGKSGREFFVLIDGTAQVTKMGDKIADLGPGDWLGEIALLTESPRTATVTTTSPVDLLVITDRRFRSVVETMPSIAIKVLACVGDRLARDARS